MSRARLTSASSLSSRQGLFLYGNSTASRVVIVMAFAVVSVTDSPMHRMSSSLMR